jgi:predicted permease
MPLIPNKTTTLNNGQKGVLTQAWFRGNTIIFGLPIVLSLYGEGCLIGCLAAPVAVSSFTMAYEMDGDGELASHMVVASTGLSIFTIFVWIFISKNLNLIE